MNLYGLNYNERLHQLKKRVEPIEKVRQMKRRRERTPVQSWSERIERANAEF